MESHSDHGSRYTISTGSGPSRLSINSSVSSLELSSTGSSRFTIPTLSSGTEPSRISISSHDLIYDSSDLSSEEDLFREARHINPDHESSEDEDMLSDPIRSLSRCTVCLDTILTNHIRTPCSHDFHHACLARSCEIQERCPNCRHQFTERWLHNNQIVITMTAPEFWEQFDASFGSVPHMGPLIPTQQYQQDVSLRRRIRMPAWWSNAWVESKLIELRMRYVIPMDLPLTIADLRYCEAMGIRSRQPQW